ncbi:hypothetical protein [Chryseobacterium rhizosphaerae]|uniref:hypothetical protein n=1 Tax=Chryseobacterium rhizosphaerae TaxID=395937 RepID=UPI002359FABA|nr:hypothetical protein [Chryseobacterium rhizosphaerae]MDC8099736.1 hypothetical protein [Chryseobacterium rhizosphaerae]
MKNTNYSILALAALGQKILKINPETGSAEILINTPGKSPDGIVVDNVYGHIYATNMGDLPAEKHFITIMVSLNNVSS